MSESTTSYVVHSHNPMPPEPGSVQIKLGSTATGKRTVEINVHAPTVNEAMALLADADAQLKARFGEGL